MVVAALTAGCSGPAPTLVDKANAIATGCKLRPDAVRANWTRDQLRKEGYDLHMFTSERPVILTDSNAQTACVHKGADKQKLRFSIAIPLAPAAAEAAKQ